MQRPIARRLVRWMGLAAVGYGSWLGLLVTHEAGHVFHAWWSGARVERVVIPLLGFSRTDVSENSQPLLVSWGGPVWGCLLPLVLLVAIWVMRRSWTRPVQFFAGLCLTANGTSLAVGSFGGVGDAGDLLRHCAAQWHLIGFGAITIPAGLWLWHELGGGRQPRAVESTPVRP